ncbi:cytochrome P460 family protein [Lutibacter sp.]|uniref:cytochrome P460 family protein n=1 Tax=Lutibacter sp. TaxID=1925666 RepID=UPI0025C59FD4|nr:cytochrome P460 family protein [Lutibacter sp.]MCF6181455.1 cytochrome P460 family protein [Lutibacter sp.]
MKVIKPIMLLLVVSFSFSLISCKDKNESDYHIISDVPDLVMPNNNLSFKEVKNYKNYKIIATHYRTDKNELRYVLANKKAFKSFYKNQPFPEGSKIVKIGWNVEKMKNFGVALEANKIQRIEYMIKDKTRFPKNPGNWGYARFVKKNGAYKSWDKGTASCIACHNLAKNNYFIFSKFQHLQ